MTTKRLAAVLTMAGTSLCAGERAPAQQATVTVCMDPDPHFQVGVRPLASAMFARIGVKIDWHWRHSCPAKADAIHVWTSYEPPVTMKSKIMAYAEPYQGTIVVFPDRVQELNPQGGSSLMGHVLVHEIAHVLEGVARHSEAGIMKARWDNQDYFEMRRKPLPFAQEDVDLIHLGLKVARVAPAILASLTVVEAQ